jgi:hypothetical protein
MNIEDCVSSFFILNQCQAGVLTSDSTPMVPELIPCPPEPNSGVGIAAQIDFSDSPDSDIRRLLRGHNGRNEEQGYP